MRIAVVTAHPDDAEIYAGGLIGAWRRMGAAVTVVVATDGSKGGTMASQMLAERRAAEARTAAALLGVDLVLMALPDGGLQAVPDLAPQLATRLAGIGPDLVVTHSPADYHADHRALAHAVQAAASFRMPLVWLDTMMGVGQEPTHYIDTTPDQDLKERAIRCHVTQDPERFVERSRLQARFRSAQCGHDGFAEALRHDPVYPFGDIRALLPPAPPVRPVRDRSLPPSTA